MEILLVARDNLIRDQVKVGLQQFQEFSVTWGEGYAAVNDVRQHRYDCIFLEAGDDHEGVRLLNHLRTFDKSTEVVIITTEKHAKEMASEKSRLNVVAFLHTPINVNEFFKLIGRFRARRRDAEAARR